jgi:hypothetical protein
MACKDICLRYRAPRPIGTGRYFTGQKRCQVCNTFIVWDELWCPCCGFRLRTRPHNSLGKQKLERMRTRRQQQNMLCSDTRLVYDIMDASYTLPETKL